MNDPPKDVTVGGVDATTSVGYETAYVDGADVSLTGEDGESEATVTTPAGLFEFHDVKEGVYTLQASLAGFQTTTFPVSVDAAEEGGAAFAPDDDDASTPSYVFLDVYLPELPATASVTPFGITVANGENPVDGSGFTLLYDESNGADVVITLDRTIQNNNPPYVIDGLSNQSASAVRTSDTVFTIPGASIAALNGAAGLTNGPLHRVEIPSILSFTPIQGAPENLTSTIRFRVVP